MKITIKNLKNQMFEIDLQSNQTVDQIKQQILKIKSIDKQLIKLVYKGKPLQSSDSLQSIQMKQGDIIIMMITQKVLTHHQKPISTNTKPQQPVKQQQPKNQPKSQTNPKVDQAYNKSVEELKNMGFSQQEVKKALKAAFNNSERAIQYLLNGIPTKLDNLSMPSQLSSLSNSPILNQLREIINQNPAVLPQILQQLQINNPQLYQMIAQNSDQFQKLLQEGGGHSHIPSNFLLQDNAIAVTSEQKEAIDRLCSFGFKQSDVVQAYIACDKDENLAANLLFDRQQKGDLNDQEVQKQNEDDDNLYS